MKYKNFLGRLISLAVVVSSLFYYNTVAFDRQQMVEEHEQKIAEAQAYNESVMALENSSAKENSTEGNGAGGNGTDVNDTHAAAYADGTYEGTGIGFGGEIQVSVTVTEGKISLVEILSADSEDQAYFNMAKVLADTIVKEQSAQVDAISGATFSSNGILEAAQDALSKAVTP